MKYFILFGFVAFVSGIEQVKFKLAPQNLQNIKNAADSCSTVHKVDTGVFPKIAEGTLPSDETNNNYLFCMVEKLKLVEANGRAIVDKLGNLLGDHPLQEQFKEAIRKCNEATKGNPVEAFMGIYRCYFDSSPVLFEF